MLVMYSDRQNDETLFQLTFVSTHSYNSVERIVKKVFVFGYFPPPSHIRCVHTGAQKEVPSHCQSRCNRQLAGNGANAFAGQETWGYLKGFRLQETLCAIWGCSQSYFLHTSITMQFCSGMMNVAFWCDIVEVHYSETYHGMAQLRWKCKWKLDKWWFCLFLRAATTPKSWIMHVIFQT